MVQIISEAPGFGARFAAGIGKGLSGESKGFVSQLGEMAQEKRLKAEQLQKEAQMNQELKNYAQKLRDNNPNSPIHQSIADIYETNLPIDKKSQIVKDLTGIDPFKSAQQKRLKVDQLMKYYNSRIKETQEQIKSVNRYSDKAPLQEELRQLQKERNLLVGNAIQDEDLEDLFMQEEEEEAEVSPVKKIKFDPQNKEHVNKLKQLEKKFGGDKKKVNAALFKEFTL